MLKLTRREALAGLTAGCSLAVLRPLGAEAPADAEPGRAAIASNDWPTFRGNPQSTGVARSPLPSPLELLWQFPVQNGAFEGTPAIVEGVVYIGDLDGKLYALDLASGQKRWEQQTENGFVASPAFYNGRIYLGDFYGKFHCFRAQDGQPLWKFETDQEIDSGANFFNGRVLVGSQDATLYCLNAETGEQIWKHTIDDQIRCSPTVSEGRTFVAGCDGLLHIIELEQGTAEAQVEFGGPTGTTPAALGTRVFFGTEGGEFFCIDWKEASVVWKFTEEQGSQAFRSSAAATPQHIVVGSRARRVYCFDPATGNEQWTFQVRRRVDSSPVIAGQHVYVAATDGRMYGLDLQTGEQVWQYEVRGGFLGSPAVSRQRMVIASDDGVVYCFGRAS